MQNFKILLIAATLVLSACHLPKPQKAFNDLENSNFPRSTDTFILDRVEGTSLDAVIDEQTGLTKTKDFTFSACLKDKKRGSSIRENSFEIRSEKSKIESKINGSGCLTWTERITVNPLMASKYLTLERSILGKGKFTGQLKFNIAVNPWNNSGEPSVLDPFYQKPNQLLTTSQSLKLLSDSNLDDQSASLISNDVRVTIQELALSSAKGGLLKLDLRLSPFISLKNHLGGEILRDIRSGQFEVELLLLNTTWDGQILKTYKLNKNVLNDILEIKGGLLFGAFDLLIPIVPSRGRLELALKMKALDGALAHHEFKGIYILGEFDNLKGSFFGRLKSGHSSANSQFNFEAYTVQGTQLDEPTQANLQDGYRKLKYEFEPLSFKFTRIGKENALIRTLHFQIKACIRNGADGSALRDHTFTVTKANGETTQRKSEYDSCIYWDDSITHDYYAKQKFVSKFVEIKNYALSINERMQVLINPWDIGTSRDARTIEGSELEEQTLAIKAPAQVVLDAYRYNAVSLDYKIDNSFALTLKKKVNLVLEPDVLIYSSLDRGLAEKENLREGVYLLRVVLQRNNFEDEKDKLRFISHSEKLVTLSQGRIATQIDLEIKDFRLMGSRNNLLIKIDPVDQSKVQIGANGLPTTTVKDLKDIIAKNSNLVSPTFIAPIVLTNDEESKVALGQNPNLSSRAVLGQEITVEQIGENQIQIDEILTKGQKEYLNSEAELQKISELKRFAALNNLTLINVDSEAPSLEMRKGLGDVSYYIRTRPQYSRYPKQEKPAIPLFELQNLLETGKLSLEMEDRLCGYWFNDLLRRRSPNQNELFFGTGHLFLTQDCQMKARKKKSYFTLEKRLQSGQVETLGHRGGNTVNINVGSSFTVSRSLSETFTKSLSINANAGVSFKFFDIFSLGSTATYSVSKAWAESSTQTNSTTVNMGSSLLARRVLVDFNLKNSKQCLVIRISPEYISGPEAHLPKMLQDRLKPEEAIKVLTTGFLICSDNVNTNDLKLTETYFFIHQDVGPSGPIDATDIRNRPLVFAFRGESSFAQFLSVAGSELVSPQQAKKIDLKNKESLRIITNGAIHMTPSYPSLYNRNNY